MKISESSYVSIGVVVLLIGSAAFVTKVNFKTEATAENLKEFKDDIKVELNKINLKLDNIQERLPKKSRQ